MASLQVGAGRGVGCCFGPLAGRRQERRAMAALRPPRAAAAGAGAKVAEEDKVRLGESSVAVSKLGIGAWSWGDTTYWNDSEWDGETLVWSRVFFVASNYLIVTPSVK